MTWSRQVLHVAGKDLRMARWLLLAGVTLIGARAARAVGFLDTGVGAFAGTFVLVVASMLVVAVLVQADSPARADALWVTGPLRPSAVFAAKLLVLLALVGVGLAGQVLALRAHDIPSGDYIPHLAVSALTFGLWLAGAAAIAALTRDLRMFVVVLVSVVTGVTVFFALLTSRLAVQAGGETTVVGVGSGGPPGLRLTLVLVGLLAVVAHQYLTRRVARGAVLAGSVVVAGTLLAAAVPSVPRQAAVREAPASLRASVVRAGVTVVEDQSGRVPPRADLRLKLGGASAAHRYALIDGDAEVHRRDGSVEPARVELDLPGSSPASLSVRVQLTAAQAAELRRSVARLVLYGRIDVAESVDVGALPVTGRGGLRFNGWRLRVVRPARGQPASGFDLRVATSVVMPPRRETAFQMPPFPWTHAFRYTLINQSGETWTVTERASSGSDFSLVLPGPNAIARVSGLLVDPIPYGRTPIIDEEWLRGARLHVMAWQSLGSYAVIATAAVDPADVP